MLKAYAHAFVRMEVRLLTHAWFAIDQPTDAAIIPDAERARIEQLLTEAEAWCSELSLLSALDQLDFIRRANNWSYDGVRQHLDEFRRRIEGELKRRTFLYVPTPRSEYYDQQNYSVHLVAKRFPSACDDIIEVGNCFALGRWTATVHHCIGVMQVGLIALAKHLKQPIDINVDDWGQIIDKVKRGSEAKLATIPRARRKKLEPFYNELLLDLGAVKTASRNPHAHFRRSFDEDQAHKVLDKLRDFMQNLAKRIYERK